ncbi:MAG: hypothetical protein ACO1RT_17270 [Planctomycetaceae bacterium]
MTRICFLLVLSLSFCPTVLGMETIWSDGQPQIQLIGPKLSGPAKDIVPNTLNRFFSDAFGWKIPVASRLSAKSINLVVGNETNNEVLKSLVAGGFDLGIEGLGDEGFRIVSHEVNGSRVLIVAGKTPQGLKHGCQEWMYFQTAGTSSRVSVDWPLDIAMKPQIAYRGIYMLPIWSAYDSLDSWKRVLRFNSELTLNRIWFWLDGFPLAGHRASAHGTDYHFDRTVLAKNENVQSLIDLVNSEAMKFYIGGGWLSWHHWEVVGQDREKARQYYFDYLQAFQGVAGFYFEPTGEGTERDDWLPGDSLQKMIADLLAKDRNFEVAVAIGSFNNADYLELMAQLDPERVFWWWCWGNPLQDKALERYPSVLGWHTTSQMSNFHGSMAPPSPKESTLAGMATSYDPGMGYGNSWNGWAKMGVFEPRNFDPYTMPYFSHQYKFRERCWNLEQTDDEFAARLSRRLFDADMPAESIGNYLKLAEFCPDPAGADAVEVARISAFVTAYADHGTARNRDTLGRMREALEGIKKSKAEARAH